MFSDPKTATQSVTRSQIETPKAEVTVSQIFTQTPENTQTKVITNGENQPTATILPANTFGIVDNSTLNGKMIIGYQGWFGCPDDGSIYDGWIHWFQYDSKPTIKNLTVDFWPDVSELTEKERCKTQLNDTHGDTLFAYSSYNPLTIRRHFYWMAEYGIDGVELQRFATELLDKERRLIRNQVAQNARDGAEAYGRVFFIQYDGIEPFTLDTIKQDWIFMMDTLNIQSSPSYLRHKGLPVVGLWGLGFEGRDVTPEEALDLIEFFKNHPDPKYRATVLGGVPTYWRTLTNDSASAPAWTSVFHSFDIINPWHVGRIEDKAGADIFLKDVIIPDLEETRALGIDYMPVIFPGFSWKNLMNGEYNAIPRLGGTFFWTLAYNVIAQDVDMIEVAMFDEVDEGTAIFKLVPKADQLPSGEVLVPLDVDGYDLPSDWYLILTGRLTQMLHGEIPLSAEIDDLPTRNLEGLLQVQLEIISGADWNSIEIVDPQIIHSIEIISKEGDLTHLSAIPREIAFNQSLDNAKAGRTITLHLTLILDPGAGMRTLEMVLKKGDIGNANLRFFTQSDGVDTTLMEVNHRTTNDGTGTNPLEIIFPLELLE